MIVFWLAYSISLLSYDWQKSRNTRFTQRSGDKWNHTLSLSLILWIQRDCSDRSDSSFSAHLCIFIYSRTRGTTEKRISHQRLRITAPTPPSASHLPSARSLLPAQTTAPLRARNGWWDDGRFGCATSSPPPIIPPISSPFLLRSSFSKEVEPPGSHVARGACCSTPSAFAVSLRRYDNGWLTFCVRRWDRQFCSLLLSAGNCKSRPLRHRMWAWKWWVWNCAASHPHFIHHHKLPSRRPTATRHRRQHFSSAWHRGYRPFFHPHIRIGFRNDPALSLSISPCPFFVFFCHQRQEMEKDYQVYAFDGVSPQLNQRKDCPTLTSVLLNPVCVWVYVVYLRRERRMLYVICGISMWATHQLAFFFFLSPSLRMWQCHPTDFFFWIYSN